MSECTVSLSHTMHIFFTLECTTLIVVSVYNLSCELLSHRLSATLTGKSDKVLHRNTLLTIRTDFCWNLECCTTDTTALNFYLRSDIIQSLLPNFESRLFLLGHLTLYGIKRIVENLIRNGFLTVIHQVINEF